MIRGKSGGPPWVSVPWGAAAGAAAALVLLSLRRRLFQATAAAGILFAGVAVGQSRTVGPALAAAAVLAAAFGIGDRIHAALLRSPAPAWAERLAVGVALGTAVLALAVLALGRIALLSPGTAAGLVAVAALVGAAGLLRPAWRPWPAPDHPPALRKGRKRRQDGPRPKGFFPHAILAAAALLQLAWAVAPEYRFDSLNYHLPAPRDWLRAGAIVPLPYWHSSLAHLAESFFVLPMALAGGQTVTLVVFGLTLATAAAAWALARNLFGAAAAPWGAALFAAAPIVGDIGSHVYADPVATLFIAAAVLAFLPLLTGDAAPGRAALFGLLAGAAVGTKINAALAILLPGILIFVLAARRRLAPAAIGAAAGAAALAAAPWFWTTWRFTGNPVFPFLNGWFRSPLAAPVSGVMNAAQFGLERSPASWPRLFAALTLETQRFGENLRPADFGIAYLLLPLLALGLKTLDRRHAAVAGTIVLYAAAWSLIFQHARYLTAVFPLIAALAAGALTSAAPDRVRPFALVAVAGALLVELLLFAGRAPEPWRLANGEETPREYLRRAIPTIDCVLELGRAAGPDGRVASVGGESVRYYVSAPIDTASESQAFARSMRGLTGERLRDALWAEGDRFLLLPGAGDRARNLRAMEDPEFLRSYAAPVCRINWLVAARLLPPGSAAASESLPRP